jgi:hypothetical protein
VRTARPELELYNRRLGPIVSTPVADVRRSAHQMHIFRQNQARLAMSPLGPTTVRAISGGSGLVGGQDGG